MRRRLLQSDFYSETELQDNAQGRPYAEGKGQMPGVVQERRKATADLHRAGRVTGGKVGKVPSRVNHQGRDHSGNGGKAASAWRRPGGSV